MSSKDLGNVQTKYKALKQESMAQWKGQFEDEEKKSDPAPPSLDEPCACFPTMTYKQRLIGFVACLVVGVCLYGLAVYFLVREDITKFAVVYTIGNIVALLSSLFLVGPLSQLKRMTRPHRIVAMLVYLSTLVLTLVVAFVMEEGTTRQRALIIICMILQLLALLWYTLSFIPYARTAFKSMLSSVCPCCPKFEVD